MKSSIVNKQQSRTFRVLLILLIVALAFSGCRQKAALEKGFGYVHTRNSSMLGVRSNTDVFAKDDVTLELCYGTYDINYCEKNGVDPKLFYRRTHLTNSKIIFGLYISDPERSLPIVNDMEISDYRAIDNHYFVKEISEDEAFSKEYGLTTSRWSGIAYNHREEITIPLEFLGEKTGSFNIKLIAFLESTDEGGGYYTTVVSHQEFRYQTLDENTIRITS